MNSTSQWKAKSWSKDAQRNLPYDKNVHRGFTDGNLRQLLELIGNFNDEFSYDDSIDVWKNERLWTIISNEMNDQRCTAAACKTEFSKLFGRYYMVLKNKSYENALKFPFFRMLHDMDLKCFDANINAVKDEFDIFNKDKFLKEADELIAVGNEENKAGTSRTFRYTDIDDNDSNNQSISLSSNNVKNETTTTAADSTPVYIVKQFDVKDPLIDISTDFGKTFRSRLYVHDIKNRELLVAAFERWNHRFLCISMDIIFEANDAWNTVYNDVKDIIPDYSAAHCSAHFNALFFQYRYILERLPHWPHERAQKYWPFFRKFHTSLKLDTFFYDVNYSRSCFDNYAKEFSTPLFGIYEGAYYALDIMPKNYFRISFADDKDKLLKLIKKFEEEFTTISNAENVWDAEGVWKFIVKDMNAIIEKNSMAKCRRQFIELLDQYITILKDLPYLTINEANKLFKFFDFFHTHLNVTPFNSRIKEYRKRFVTYKTNPDSTVTSLNITPSSSKQSASKEQKQVQSKAAAAAAAAALVEEDEDEYDEDQENVELVLYVQENIKMFKNFSVSDDDVWMRVALDLNKFEPIIEKGKEKWKDRFYSLMRKFLKYSAFGDEEGQNKWLLYNQFKSLDLNPFLDRLQNPIKHTKTKMF